jgi:(2Fe-2S) ferredoxin
MPRPDRHIFVCAQNRPDGHPRGSCGAKSAGDVLQRFADLLTKKRLLGKVALTQTNCLGPCHVGANVLVYPEGVMYAEVNAADVDEIVDKHLIGGEPVTEKLAAAEVW